MDSNLFTDTILAYKRRVPFHPFTIVTAAGRQHEVDHQDAIIVKGGVAMFLAPGNIPHIFDAETISEIVGDLSQNVKQQS